MAMILLLLVAVFLVNPGYAQDAGFPLGCKLEGKFTVLVDASVSIVKAEQDGNLKSYTKKLMAFLLDPKRRMNGKDLEISLSTFGAPGKDEVVLDFADKGDVSVSELQERIDLMEFTAGSCLSDAIAKVKSGFTRVKKDLKETIIFVGDGNADCTTFRSVTSWNADAVNDMQQLKNSGVRVIAFGFLKSSKDQITKLASSVDQAFFFADMDKANLNSALSTTLKKTCRPDPNQVVVVRAEEDLVACRKMESGLVTTRYPSVTPPQTCESKQQETLTIAVEFAIVFENTIIVSEAGSVLAVVDGECYLNGSPMGKKDVCSLLFADLSFLYTLVRQDEKCASSRGVCDQFSTELLAKKQKGVIVFMEGRMVNLDSCSTGRLYKSWSDNRAAICRAVLSQLTKIGNFLTAG